jgi:hypothetical protein
MVNFICSISSARAFASASAFCAFTSAATRAACAVITIAFSVPMSSGRESAVRVTPMMKTHLRLRRSAEAVEQWLTLPPKEALALQKPLPDGALRIVATGEKEDGLAA